MVAKSTREKALEARIAELERELADARAAARRAIAELRKASSIPRRDRKAYMREFMRRKRATKAQ